MRAARPLLLTTIALLAACASEPAPSDDNAAASRNVAAPPGQTPAESAAPAAQQAPALAIEGEGLRLFNPVNGSARPIPFGTPRQATLAAVAFRGAPSDTGALDECSAGRLDTASWRDGLTLYFQDEKFVGWALGGTAKGDLTTASGIGLGSTRAELENAYSAKIFESTLGTEFTAGDIFGILEGKRATATITNLWAGASCNMR